MHLRRQTTAAGRRRALRALGAAALAPAFAPLARAQAAYPSKPIRIIVPHSPGVSPDVIARYIADRMSKTLGQPAFVENHAGAGGLIGAEYAANAAPDGYNLMFTVKGVMAMVPNVYPNPKYNPMTDFKAIAEIATVPHVLTAAPNTPFNSLKEMVEYAKANPDKINFASNGIGSQPHMTMEAWQKKLGIKLHHIPYKQNPETDLMGGIVSLYLEGGAAAVPKVKAGRVKGLCITGSTRNPEIPNVPAANEYMPDLDPDGMISGSYHALFAPKGTPDEIVTHLNRELTRILAQAEVQTRLRDFGVNPNTTVTAAGLNTAVARDYQFWRGIVKELDIKPV
ncbi:MAG TPA: tripartite tricarboxylate transporter substrate binding protein [Burkholderiales bacterium]|jgi:tripartite-type tricarboxylate transporter receptor subunit TctC